MGTDDNPLILLRDHVDFFEKLRDVNLPNSLENTRTNLLRRSRTVLAAHEPIPSSSEPYLDMKPGKGKGLTLSKLEKPDDTILTEYIDTDNNQISWPSLPLTQNDYESFGNVPSNQTISYNDKAEEEILKIYKGFTAEQTINKCHKSGPLYRRQDDKWIFKERPCFIGLVGRHLLVYPKKESKAPNEIFSIRNFSARPAPKLLPKDVEKAKSLFEVYAPGCPTLQFIARTPKEMEQWVAVINRVGSSEQSAKFPSEIQDFSLEHLVPNIDLGTSEKQEQYQDTGQIEDCTKKSLPPKSQVDQNHKMLTTTLSVEVTSGNPPPLPARIPRRLPSLPAEATVSYQPDENYEKDELYHTIEDLKAGTTYQNLAKPTTPKKIVPDEKMMEELELYDDIQGITIQPEETLETYDDTALTECTKRENVKDPLKKKPSFLDRIKGKKESPKKKEKMKIIAVESPKAIEQELPTYDEVFEISGELKHDKNEEKELGNYVCPPPPRPVYTKSPSKFVAKEVVNEEEEEQIYDDVGQMREAEKVESSLSNENCELEHYQVPRAQDSIDPTQLDITSEEELYDDIAILNEFRARKRDSACSSSSSEKTINNVTKTWNRFSSGKRTSDKSNSRRNASEECSQTCVDSGEETSDMKRNKFQKLFIKMEYSLSKSGKPPISPMITKYDGN